MISTAMLNTIMDRPEELTCHRCHKAIGYLSGETVTQRCPACGVYSQPGKGSRGVPATARVMELERHLVQLDRDFEEGKRPFLIRTGGSRVSPGILVTPDQSSVGIGTLLTGIFGMLALVLGFYGFILITMALLAAAACAYWMGDTSLKAKREGYERLKQNWLTQRRRALEEIHSQLKI